MLCMSGHARSVPEASVHPAVRLSLAAALSCEHQTSGSPQLYKSSFHIPVLYHQLQTTLIPVQFHKLSLSQFHITTYSCPSSTSQPTHVPVPHHNLLMSQFHITTYSCPSSTSQPTHVPVPHHNLLMSQFHITTYSCPSSTSQPTHVPVPHHNLLMSQFNNVNHFSVLSVISHVSFM